jgi:DHA2 family multidrug resistance protein-like MFS transporter
VGGEMLAHYGWGSLFLMNLPVMGVLLATGPFFLPEYKDPNSGKIHLVSVGLSLLAVFPLTFALKTFATDGLTTPDAVAAVVGVVAAVVFVMRQRTLTNPLLDLKLFRSRPFSAALVILMLAVAAQAGIVLLVSQHLQIVEGLSPLRAGWTLMPASVAMVIACLLSPLVGRWVRRGWIVTASLLITAVGYIALSQVGDGGNLPLVTIALVLIFFGIGPVAVFSQDLIVGSVTPERAGSAAALSETSGDFGIALGIAVLGSVSTAIYVHRQSPSGHGSPLTAGLHLAAIACAVVSVGLAVVAATALSPVARRSP